MHFCSRCVHSTSANENFVEIISWTKAAKLRNKSLSVVVEGEKKNTPKKILSVQYYIWINNYGSKPFTFQGLKQMTCNLKRHTQSTENDLVLPKVVEIFKIGPIQMYSTLLLAYGTAWKPHEPIFFYYGSMKDTDRSHQFSKRKCPIFVENIISSVLLFSGWSYGFYLINTSI